MTLYNKSPKLEETKRIELEELVERSRHKKYTQVFGTLANGISTIDYHGIEVADGIILGTIRIPITPPLLYLGGEVKEDGIQISYGRFTNTEEKKLIELLRSANPYYAERKIHFLHPQLAHPSIKGLNWDKWKLSDGNYVEEAKKHEGINQLVISESKSHIKDDLKIAFLACGMGIEIDMFYRDALRYKLQHNFADIHIIGIDFNEKLLEIARYNLPGNVILICDDLRNLPDYFKDVKVDLAIGVGLFDTQTLEWNEGLEILDKVRYILTDDGHGIFTSYGPELFYREHYEQLGFKVKSCSIPTKFFTGAKSDLYVVQKQNSRTINSELSNSLYIESDQWRKYPNLIV